MKIIKKTYFWKILIEGLLQEPKNRGPHYEETSLNGWHGEFDSPEEAEEALLKWDKDNTCPNSYVLVTECQVINKPVKQTGE